MVKIIETPRDGFQGLPNFIPTNKKIEYINLLLKCGFNTVEVGSFVSPRAIPQMADTDKVLDGIDFENSKSKIAILTATKKGGDKAMSFEQIDQIFFPFAISPIFLKKNINQTLEQAEETVDELQNMCVAHNKELVVYFSMGFGSAYGDEWSIDLLHYWINKMKAKGLNIFPFSDILGNASPDAISTVFSSLVSEFTDTEFGLHLHSLDYQRIEKVDAAYKAGIRMFDTVINGLGGCPQTGKELVGNLPLESLLDYFNNNNISTILDTKYLRKAIEFSIYP
ncbi:MAG: hydroxymethylglutaryl-CoA lyase [Bacteroidota bacterium]